MTKTDSGSGELPANVVGIGAISVCADEAKRTRYPVEWIECCREIYASYRAHLEKKERRTVGTQRIRDLIMAGIDQYDGHKLVERTELFTKQDYESFLKGSVPGPGKFKFLDFYLHKELLDPDTDFSAAARQVIDFRERMQHRAMQVLYFGDRRTASDATMAEALKFADGFYVVDEPASAEENFRTALYIKPDQGVRFLVVAWYYKFTAQSPDEIICHGYPTFGYLLPICMADALKGVRSVYAILKLFDRSLFATKEAIFHTASHCFLTDGGEQLKVADIHGAEHPFRAVTPESTDKDEIRAVVAATLPTLYPSYALQSSYFTRVPVSEEIRKQINTLHEEYLLW